MVIRILAIASLALAISLSISVIIASSRGDRIDELEEQLARAERGADALADFASRMEKMHAESRERLADLEQALADATLWRDCTVPTAVVDCLCDDREIASPRQAAGALHPVDDLK